jgi:hypothetical protein
MCVVVNRAGGWLKGVRACLCALPCVFASEGAKRSTCATQVPKPHCLFLFAFVPHPPPHPIVCFFVFDKDKNGYIEKVGLLSGLACARMKHPPMPASLHTRLHTHTYMHSPHSPVSCSVFRDLPT